MGARLSLAEEPVGGVGVDPGDEEGDELNATPAHVREQLLSSLQVSEAEVCKLLKLPQRYPDGRAHPCWIAARKNRVTASRFAAACSAPGARSNRKVVVADMLALPEGRAVQATRFGVQHEDVAREAYIAWRRSEASKQSASDLDLQVEPLGLCVWLQEPWLAGSPDGLCVVEGKPEGLLEIKTAKEWNGLFQSEDTSPIP
ncbi:Slc35a3 [Symbiodinium natans]|uniref:Slc35a3 protein n=1 Tax=Symbiodinium natans TaxID=878477 RepID=A0A812L6D4_9DINO|nr:Slc35a3 [Symbiodinium natans]